jgi:hypothetical protein
MAAAVTLPIPESHLNIALEIERLEDPLVRDALFRAYYKQESPVTIAKAQGLRPLTVRQSLRRGLRKLGKDENDLEVLRSSETIQPPYKLEAAVRALENNANKLNRREGSLLVLGLAAAAAEAAQTTSVVVGMRSVRPKRGRPWIERTEPRPPALKGVAEAPAPYGDSRSYDIKARDWKARLVQSASRGVAVRWLSGGNGIAVSDGNYRLLGECTEESPSLSIPGITLPAELRLRALGPTID